jgi:hypothetical protein
MRPSRRDKNLGDVLQRETLFAARKYFVEMSFGLGE